MIRFWLVIAGIAGGLLLASVAPGLIGAIRTQVGALPGMAWLKAEGVVPATEPHAAGQAHHDEEGAIKLSDQQIAAAGIEVRAVEAGILSRRRFVPGTLVPAGDRIGRVAVRLLGTVTELRKRLGDSVEQNEVVAVIESREVADAKSEYLATRVTDELQQTLFTRATSLWQGKVITENDYLRARASAQEARVKFDTARQKLFTLGLSEEQIAVLPNQPAASLRRQELRSPIGGRIAERRVDLGALVGREGQESELYVVVDLSELWVDLAVAPADLPAIREGQEITVAVGTSGRARAGADHIREPAARSRYPRGPRGGLARQSRSRISARQLRDRGDHALAGPRRGRGSESRIADDQGRARGVRAQRARLRGPPSRHWPRR
jgi:hypothetical protein